MGVYYEASSGKYRARLQVRGVRYHLGRFQTRDLAEVAYASAKKFYLDYQFKELFTCL